MDCPRALALAELPRSTHQARDWVSFLARIPPALRTLGRRGVAFRIPHVEGLEGDRLTLDDNVTITLSTAMPGAQVRYTTDGTDPTATSALYERPFQISATPQGTRVTARTFTADGRASAPRAATFTRTTYRPADDLLVVEQGIRHLYFQRSVRSVRSIDTLSGARESKVTSVALQPADTAERYAVRMTGYLRVPDDALYEFALSSDDGSNFEIGGQVVVNNDGLHGDEERTGMIALRKGLHPFVVRYFQGGGGASLALRYRRNAAQAWQIVPESWHVQAALPVR
jgi:hexosaminidase